MPDGIPKHHKLLVLQPLLSLHLQPSITHLVLLSTACPTSLASDQTKGGGRPGVQRTPRFGDREQRFDLTKIQLSSKLSPKDPKEFAKKFRDATGEPREKRLLQITNLKATLQRLHRLYIYHTEKRSGRAMPEIFAIERTCYSALYSPHYVNTYRERLRERLPGNSASGPHSSRRVQAPSRP